jgi:hypothetical protein
MKKLDLVWQTLNDLIKNEELYIDVREEIASIIDILKPLDKPNQLRATG